jgi:hypothetical protein
MELGQDGSPGNGRRPGAGRWVQDRLPRRGWLAALIILALWAFPGWAATAPDTLLEDLHYRVDVLVWQDIARARLTLKSLGPGRYLAEIAVAARGLLQTMSGDRRENYQTEMVWREGKLMPVVYREESRRRGKRRLKEYRFDYARGKLELWQLKEGKGLVRKWQTPLTEPIYDPLSTCYNCRLGFWGPMRGGQVFKIKGIPYPKPEVMEVRVGAQTKQGCQIMITIGNQGSKGNKGQNQVFAYLDGQLVPQGAWTTVWGLGKISGELLPGGKGLEAGLPEVAPAREANAAPGS